MYRFLRRLLFLIPPETAHRLGIFALRLLGLSKPLCRRLRQRATRSGVKLGVRFAGLDFPNPIGLAAGLDKNAEAIEGLFALGFGAIEVGTFTPEPQPGNPQPRLFRIPEHRALINRMGFNNCGAKQAARHLARASWRPGVLGINLGKNLATPLERADEDYLRCMEILGPAGDYLVVNASSPNTPGLRELQAPQRLSALLEVLHKGFGKSGRPLFLKISPDLAPESVDELVDTALSCQLDGLIATNTTLQRPFQHRLATEGGGLSGMPLKPLSEQIIRRAYARAGGRLPIIGVGGVFTAEDVYHKLKAGASMVQIYTALVYEGPGLVARLLSDLARLLERDGFASVSSCVGADHPKRAPIP